MYLEEILEEFNAIIKGVVSAEAPIVDQQAKWPEKSMRQFQQKGLAGLVVPKEYGGLGQGLTGLAKACEQIGQVSGSTALCFGMHCVGSAVIAAKPSSSQEKDFLEPIVRGEHLTSLAVSEPGTGAHFYLPQTQLYSISDNEFRLKGEKTFVTNGGHCDSYVVSTVGVEADAPLHQFSCVMVEKSAEGLSWGPEWTGLGMRGNSSRNLNLKEVIVPARNLLGERGDQLWYVFQVIAPYFLTAMAGTYLGIAQAAFEEVKKHLMERGHSHSGMMLSQIPHLQHRLGTLWAKIERSRQLLYHAAGEGDLESEDSLLPILSAKAEVANCVEKVVNEAMNLCGGIAYRENGRFDVLLRDAKAAHIMSPTTDLLYTWLGRAILDQPMLHD